MFRNNIPDVTEEKSTSGSISSRIQGPEYEKFNVYYDQEDSKLVLRSKVNFKKGEKVMIFNGMF